MHIFRHFSLNLDLVYIENKLKLNLICIFFASIHWFNHFKITSFSGDMISLRMAPNFDGWHEKGKDRKKLLNFFQISGRLRMELSGSGTMNALYFFKVILEFMREELTSLLFALMTSQ